MKQVQKGCRYITAKTSQKKAHLKRLDALKNTLKANSEYLKSFTLILKLKGYRE